MSTNTIEDELRSFFQEQADLVSVDLTDTLTSRDYQPRAHQPFVVPSVVIGAAAIGASVVVGLGVGNGHSASTQPDAQPSSNTPVSTASATPRIQLANYLASKVGPRRYICNIPDCVTRLVPDLPPGATRHMLPPIPEAPGVDLTYFATANPDGTQNVYLPATLRSGKHFFAEIPNVAGPITGARPFGWSIEITGQLGYPLFLTR